MKILYKSVHLIENDKNLCNPVTYAAELSDYFNELLAHVAKLETGRKYRSCGPDATVVSCAQKIWEKIGAEEDPQQQSTAIAERLLKQEKKAQIKIQGTQAIGTCISQLSTHLKKNLMAVLSFILTVVLASIVSERGMNEIFTYEVVRILDIVLMGSLAYFGISLVEVFLEKKRLLGQYDDLLSHYERVLTKKDIQDITQKDAPRKKAEKKLRNGMIGLSLLWISLIILAGVLIRRAGGDPSVVTDLIALIFGGGTGTP